MLRRRQLRRWFPDDELLVVPAATWPEEIGDPGTRTLMTEVGVPESFLEVMELDVHLQAGVQRTADLYLRYDEVPPPGTGALFHLGFVGQHFLAVDGPTGRILQVDREHGCRPLAGNLESFLRLLGFVGRQVRRHQRRRTGTGTPEEFAERLTADALERLERIDPGVLPDAAPAWRAFLHDVAMNAS